ncbi:hypothetical protein C8J57DRAFT_260095 [Mycena rebaudengoi]|nr:hypothetical protein C8J57DRAFT_260095 [Mycena rebaudengoi]
MPPGESWNTINHGSPFLLLATSTVTNSSSAPYRVPYESIIGQVVQESVKLFCWSKASLAFALSEVETCGGSPRCVYEFPRHPKRHLSQDSRIRVSKSVQEQELIWADLGSLSLFEEFSHAPHPAWLSGTFAPCYMLGKRHPCARCDVPLACSPTSYRICRL